MQEKVKYILKWNAAPRPPVHPDWMLGTMAFKTMEGAIAFFSASPLDSEFVSLTKVTTIEEDISKSFPSIFIKEQ